MYTAKIRRKQLYLTDDLDDRLKDRSAVSGRSEAALVREALEAYLQEPGIPAGDPILGLAGLATAEPPARAATEDDG
jgi:plasmid stability protein